MQNRAGRSSPADQNALFSEFSPFTRGEREAASLGSPPLTHTHTHTPDPPEAREDQNKKHQRGVGGTLRDASLEKKPGRNQQVTDFMEETHR